MFWRRLAAGHLSAFYRKKILFYLLNVEIKLGGGVGHRHPPNLRGKLKANAKPNTRQYNVFMKMLNYTERKNKEKEKKKKKSQTLKYRTTVDMINLKMPVPFISSYLHATG